MKFSAPQVAALKDFVSLLKANPELLHDPALGFFRQYLESLGATIPTSSHDDDDDHDDDHHSHAHAHAHDDHDHGHTHSHAHGHEHDHSHSHAHSHVHDEVEEEEEEEEEEIPDLEDAEEPVDPDVIPRENDPPQPTGDQSKEISDEDRDKASALRGEASEAASNADFAKAVELLTEAIVKHNGSSAPLYASRGQFYLKLKKPASAIRDAEVALRINPDSATAYRVRGRARALLGEWENAVADLNAANSRDYDPDVNDLIKTLTPKAHAVAERRKAREEQAKRRKTKASSGGSHSGSGFPGAGAGFPGGGAGFPGGGAGFPGGGAGFPGGGAGFPGGGAGFPGAGAGAGAGVPPEVLAQLMSDPEFMAALQDPTVLPILTEISSDPSKIEKYKDHPKLGKIYSKFSHFFNK